MFTALLNPLAVIISLCTATGVLVHDMHIDAATSTALALPSVVVSHEAGNRYVSFDGNAHTHVERTSLSQAIINLKTQNPRIQPRTTEDKKHLLQKRVVRGHYAFDNYNLPITS